MHRVLYFVSQGQDMNFFTRLITLYKLDRDGELARLIAAFGDLNDRLADLQKRRSSIDSGLNSLQKDISTARTRLSAAQDAAVRKSLGITGDISTASQHKSFETTYRAIAAGCSPFLVGPAGSGKSTILAQIAAAMELPFYPMSVNALTSDYNIIGYNDANGKYVPTIFRMAYENGGIFSFEEIDAGNPNVLTVINNAMSQDKYAFPDKIVDKNPKFILTASGNTYGTGANMQYVGRNPLDAATLDRFVMVYTDYDTQLEERLCTNKEWLNYVHSVRDAVNKFQMRLVVGTRAVIHGDKLLAAGLARDAVAEMVLFKGIPLSDIQKIRDNIKSR